MLPAPGSLFSPQIGHGLFFPRLPEVSLDWLWVPRVPSEKVPGGRVQATPLPVLFPSLAPKALKEKGLSDAWCPELTPGQTDRDCSVPIWDPVPGRR